MQPDRGALGGGRRSPRGAAGTAAPSAECPGEPPRHSPAELPPGPPGKRHQQVPAGNSFVLQAWMSDPCGNCRLFSQTQKAVKSPQHELGMTPIAESLAGSSGGQLRFIKQLILLADNSPPPNLHSHKDLRSSGLIFLGGENGIIRLLHPSP